MAPISRVCDQGACHNCAALSLSLLLTLRLRQPVRPPPALGCAPVTLSAAADAFRAAGACAGDPCGRSVPRLGAPCVPARLRVMARPLGGAAVLRLARQRPFVTTFSSTYPACGAVDHAVVVLRAAGRRGVLVQNSYGAAWQAGGRAFVPVERFKACGVGAEVVVLT